MKIARIAEPLPIKKNVPGRVVIVDAYIEVYIGANINGIKASTNPNMEFIFPIKTI